MRRIRASAIYWVIGIPVAILAALATDAVTCSLVPPLNQKRVFALYGDGRSALFRIEGTRLCFFSTEGSFPEWGQYVRVTFDDRDSFLSFGKDVYIYNEDFEGSSIRSGKITVNRAENTAALSLIFINGYEFNEPVNGTYNLAQPQLIEISAIPMTQ